MKFLILLACLGIERYLSVGTLLRRFAWFDDYLIKYQSFFSKNCALFKGYLGIAALALPIIAIVGLPYFVVVHYKLGLSGIGFHFAILIYCFGPLDLNHQLQIYFKLVNDGKDDQAACVYQDITQESMSTDKKVRGKKLTEAILVQANNGFFVIVFWYLILGPLGALGYRLISLLARSAEQGKESCLACAHEVIQLNNWLNVIPARIMALFYVFVGGFQTLSVWWAKALSTTSTNEDCLIICGMASLKHEKELSLMEESKRAMVMTNRALIGILVVIAIFSLGSLIK